MGEYEWQDGRQKPDNIGIYERCFNGDIHKNYWDGTHWFKVNKKGVVSRKPHGTQITYAVPFWRREWTFTLKIEHENKFARFYRNGESKCFFAIALSEISLDGFSDVLDRLECEDFFTKELKKQLTDAYMNFGDMTKL